MKKIFLLLVLFAGGIFGEEDYKLTAEQKVTAEGVTVFVTMDISKNVHIYATQFFEVKDTASSGLGESKITLPKLKKYKDFTGVEVDVYAGKAVIEVFKPFTNRESWSWELAVQTQGCTNTLCFPPRTDNFKFSSGGSTSAVVEQSARENVEPLTVESKVSERSDLAAFDQAFDKFNVVKSGSGYKNAEDFTDFLKDGAEAGGFEGLGVFALIITVLLGGLALNLTPCILPMIPINLGIIGAGVKADSKWHGFMRGGFYGLGIAFAYGVLGLAAVLGGASFGTLNSSPWFNFGIAAVFIVLGLAIMDVFIIDFSKFKSNKSAGRAKSGTFVPVFLLGAVSALLAGACVAPVVIAVLLYSTQQYSAGNTFALLLPFLLGIGMALPWPLAGAGIGVLPKPGMWMSKVKVVFGILIFAFAAYYGHLGYTLLPKGGAEESAGFNPKTELVAFTRNLEQAAAAGRPVVVDFWATWCSNCIKMKETTFKHPKVIEELKRFDFVVFQAEKPSDETVKYVQEKFGVLGLPTYLILEPK